MSDGSHLVPGQSTGLAELETLSSGPDELGRGRLVGSLAGETGGVCGPEGVLAHHLSLGVAVAGVQAVGPARHGLAEGDGRMTEDVTLVVLSYPGTQTPGHARPLAPLPGLTLVVEALAGTLPDTSETSTLQSPAISHTQGRPYLVPEGTGWLRPMSGKQYQVPP